MTVVEKNDAQLQELYNHLDHCEFGDKYMCYYGQCRAQEMTHREALAETVTHFSLASRPWYLTRIKTGMIQWIR